MVKNNFSPNKWHPKNENAKFEPVRIFASAKPSTFNLQLLTLQLFLHLRIILVKVGNGFYPFQEIKDAEVLVRGVNQVTIKTKAHHN